MIYRSKVDPTNVVVLTEVTDDRVFFERLSDRRPANLSVVMFDRNYEKI